MEVLRIIQHRLAEYKRREAEGSVKPAFHVDFHELVKDPITVVEKIYQK